MKELRAAADKTIVVYPNGGGKWDAMHRCFTGLSDTKEIAESAEEWLHAGAQIIGGCCRTGPEFVGRIAQVAITAA